MTMPNLLGSVADYDIQSRNQHRTEVGALTKALDKSSDMLKNRVYQKAGNDVLGLIQSKGAINISPGDILGVGKQYGLAPEQMVELFGMLEKSQAFDLLKQKRDMGKTPVSDIVDERGVYRPGVTAEQAAAVPEGTLTPPKPTVTIIPKDGKAIIGGEEFTNPGPLEVSRGEGYTDDEGNRVYPFFSKAGDFLGTKSTGKVKETKGKDTDKKLSEEQKARIKASQKIIESLMSPTTLDKNGFEVPKSPDQKKQDTVAMDFEFFKISAVEQGKIPAVDPTTGKQYMVTQEEFDEINSNADVAEEAEPTEESVEQSQAPLNDALRGAVEAAKMPAEKVKSVEQLSEKTKRTPSAPWIGAQPEEYTGNTLATTVQNFAGKTQLGNRKKFGEGDIEFALRQAGIEEENLQARKNIAKKLKSLYKKDEAEIARMIQAGEILSEGRGR